MLGEVDIYAVVEMPNAASMAAGSLMARSSGFVNVTCVPLISPEEIDEASKKVAEYRAPGK